jgi:hypothetical protein
MHRNVFLKNDVLQILLSNLNNFFFFLINYNFIQENLQNLELHL